MTRGEVGDEKAAMRRFELQWSRSWPDRSHDFSAFDRELLVGRIHRLTGGPAGDRWSWSMLALVGNRQATETGIADDRDAACLQVERNYRVFRQRIGGA
jgi:hypothetical protein